jgi:hypothetical protein
MSITECATLRCSDLYEALEQKGTIYARIFNNFQAPILANRARI